MGKIVLITEKPSVAREYAKVLAVRPTGKADGYVEGYSSFLDKTVAITWCIGHLVTMSYPEKYREELKKWSLDTLPFLPDNYLYEVINNPGIRKQFSIVKKLYNDKDTDAIYYAGDSGREGIYIQELVRMLAGHKKGIEEKVVWIDSQTEEEIKRGIKEAKDISYYQNLINAGYMRAIEDYTVGINFSRGLTCKYGREFNTHIGSKNYTAIAVGRVMTCVLGMIVKREREIREFIETPFYRIEAINPEDKNAFSYEWKADKNSKYFESPLLYNETGFLKKEDANNLANECKRNPALTIEDVKVSKENKKAPLLFNLAELQFECSKKYRISPDQTLQIAQTLYERKFITYPRTDARVLSSAVAKEITNNLSGLGHSSYSDIVSKILKNGWEKGIDKSKYTNDKQITDHYAIIPTGIIPKENELNALEEAVYEDIIKRFLSIFYPAAVYEKTNLILVHTNSEHFYGTIKVLKEYGYLEVYPKEERSDTINTESFSFQKGDSFTAEYVIKEGKTTPPKRYSSGSIILAMENAGKMIEDEELREQIKGSGIGTSATRAEIIKKLITNKYININTKTQILTPDMIGETVYDIVEKTIPELLSAEMTANWEKGLSAIENGSLDMKEYRKELEKYVLQSIENVKNKNTIEYSTERKSKEMNEVLGKCPNCGSEIVSGKFGPYCKDKCGMVVSKAMGKTLTDAQVKNLLAGKKVLLKGLQSKDKTKTYDAYITTDGIQKFSYSGNDGQTKEGIGFKFKMEFENK